MSKILRIYEEGGETSDDWGKARKYGSDVIKKINDPAGLTAKKEITSIPSPFARIDLAKTAFKFVVDSGNLDGETIYHRIVSDCLDVGEIFFNFDKLTYEDPNTHENMPMFEIVVWDRENEIEKLIKSRLREHRILGETLNMYLSQDAKAYNFDALKRFYLLKYNGPGHKQMDIVGATSPATLFFSTANNLNRISLYICFGGNDRPFDNEFTSLHKRDFKFQKYLYALQKSFDGFRSMFSEVSRYLDDNYNYLSDKMRNEIDALDALDNKGIDAYDEFAMAGNVVNVNGMPLRKYPKSLGIIESDFAINSTICDGKRPLVLPVEAGDKYVDLKYVNDKWNKNYHAPYYDNRTMENRVLPETSEKFPYLTIGDFLQPTIVSMPYQLNVESFFDGNSNDDDQTFLLPLTDRFFEYFSADDLMGTVKDGHQTRKMVEMKPVGNGAVMVVLRIPIQKSRVIEYEKMYYKDVVEDGKSGLVVEKRFGLGVFPLIDFRGIGQTPFYRIAFFSKSKDDELLFFEGKTDVDCKAHVVRREADRNCSIESYVVEKAIDRIVFQSDGTCNVIIPKLLKPSGRSQFVFAIDFGTTNTHVEYAKDGESKTQPFDIGKEDRQMQRLHTSYSDSGDRDIEFAFDDVFVPDAIGGNGSHSFPIRSVFSESKKINYNTQTNTLADGNIPFRYGMASNPLYNNKPVTDLKWSNDKDNAKRIEMYIENLFLLLRNKVLLNDGDLQATRIVWFYPASMTHARRNEFKGIWKRLYDRYFGGSGLEMMSESIAPYYYYKQKKGAKSNVVTIDIGGGTTDVFVVEEGLQETKRMLSSFRFAANAIFGDGYNFSSSENGFVNAFKGEVEKVFEDNKDKDGISNLREAYKAILDSENSTDVINFFFSLTNNKVIKSNEIPYDFLLALSRDEDFKYVFIVFYGAILCYVAAMMKSQGYKLPQTLAFSGNGSKTLFALSDDETTIASFASRIFEKVFGQQYKDTSLNVVFDENPKLATCKGGIAVKNPISFDDLDGMKMSLLGTDDNTMASEIKYSSLGEEHLKQVAAKVSGFIDGLFEIGKEKSFFTNLFNASRKFHENAKSCCQNELAEYTKQGLQAKRKELEAWGTGDDVEIEETMFFYPLVAVINRLALEMFKLKNNKP